MYYQITAPPTAIPDKQAEELGRLLTHSKRIQVQFVTVAGSYKPTRARLTLLTIPDRFTDHAARVLALLAGVEEAVKPSAALRPRAEWSQQVVLLPTTPDAPPLDGTLLDGWVSACLALAYRPGRVLARLAYCPEDAARVAQLAITGWQVLRPNPVQTLALGSGRAWTGVPSFAPVPGGVPPILATPVDAPTAARDATAAPHADDSVLTDDSDGFMLGVAPDGQAVRVARRAMTLAVSGPPDAQQRAVLALLRRGMQAGMGMVAVVDRALMPTEALHAWEARMRLLDVQNIADSSAIPWRDIAPDLLAQAIGGPAATLSALPARFGALLDTLGASALRVPAILGLATMPGDNLRGALAAGGMVVVPQDGDTASAVLARLLMAYLATPPAIGRGLLVVTDPGVVLPDALRQQAIQVVIGTRSDAVLCVRATENGWSVCGPDGAPVAELGPDLLAQPTDGVGDLVDSIVRAMQVDPAAAAALSEPYEAADTPDGWWAAAPRSDDLDTDDDPDTVPLAQADDAESGDSTFDLADAPHTVGHDDNGESADAAPADDRDVALGALFAALQDAAPTDPRELVIHAALARDDVAAADDAARDWATAATATARPWLWRVVLAEDDADRVDAAWRSISSDPAGPHAALVHAVLAALGATEPVTWHADPTEEPAALPVVLPGESVPTAGGGEHVPPPAHPASLRELPAVGDPVVNPPPAPDTDLHDVAIHAAWQAGESVPQLVARLVASGVAAPTARARVRAIIQGHAPAAPPTPAPLLVVQALPPLDDYGADHGIPGSSIAPMPDAMPDDDDAIWQAWQDGTKTDDLVVALCGKRGGSKADAARDRIYGVVVPRTIALLDCADLADRLADGEAVTDDPRYPELMQRLARSKTPPAGNLARSLIKRLISVRQEV